jgi:trehalose 6-phosphate phosphatase
MKIQSEPLADSLLAALRKLAATDRLLVALDFDGTLAPEVDDPQRARALPESQAAVMRLLASPHTRVALVSGRALASLQQVTDVPKEVLLVGSHGIELRLDTPDTQLSLTPTELARVRELKVMLEEISRSFEGAWVEPKPAGFALHTRRVIGENGRAARQLAQQRAETELPGLTMRRGKNLVEFSVRSTTKGEAVEFLRDYTDATAVFYTGDDVTDEDAFAALSRSDVGVKCGRGETAADFRVSDPWAVAAVLHTLADLREAWEGA